MVPSTYGGRTDTRVWGLIESSTVPSSRTETSRTLSSNPTPGFTDRVNDHGSSYTSPTDTGIPGGQVTEGPGSGLGGSMDPLTNVESKHSFCRRREKHTTKITKK